MKNTPSRLEKRLAQVLATTPPPDAHTATGQARLDIVYLSADDQDRLDRCLRE